MALPAFICQKRWRLWVSIPTVTVDWNECCRASECLLEICMRIPWSFPARGSAHMWRSWPCYSQADSRKSISELTPLLGLQLQSPPVQLFPAYFQCKNITPRILRLVSSACISPVIYEPSFSHKSWSISLKHFTTGICSHVCCQTSVNHCTFTSPTCINRIHVVAIK